MTVVADVVVLSRLKKIKTILVKKIKNNKYKLRENCFCRTIFLRSISKYREDKEKMLAEKIKGIENTK